MSDTTTAEDRCRGVLIGLAAGDQIGGPIRMALRLAESLLECGGFDLSDILNRYLAWRHDGAFDSAGVISLDVQADRKGEFFEIVRQPGVEAELAVLDVQPTDRHLLLLVRQGKDKSKFLCGHDERHWFVAGIPETAPVGTVRQAKEALKPVEVQTAQARKGPESTVFRSLIAPRFCDIL